MSALPRNVQLPLQESLACGKDDYETQELVFSCFQDVYIWMRNLEK